MIRQSLYFIALLIITSPFTNANESPLPWANPWDVGMDYKFVNQAYTDLAASVQNGAAPGVVAIVIKDGNIIALKAVGNMQSVQISRSRATGQLEEQRVDQPMVEGVIFDLASVTKMVAATTSIMKLVEDGKIGLDKTVASYIPTFGKRAKNKVTVRNLITHTSGLPAWSALYDVCSNIEDVYKKIDEETALIYPPGENRIYSDLGFITLGRLVEVVSGQRIDHYSKQHIFEPLGMDETGYLPWGRQRLYTAPTEYDSSRDRILQGIVHDENTRIMGGVSGHAGLFSTAMDMAVFAQMLLNGGEFKGIRILKKETIDMMLTPQYEGKTFPDGTDFLTRRRQLLGWWGMDNAVSLNYMGGLPSKTAYSHTGFTGTAICIDPEHNCAAILLSNAVHPRRADAQKSQLRRDFFHNIAKALVGEDKVNIIAPSN